MDNKIEKPKIRYHIQSPMSLRSPVVREEFWGPGHFVNHKFDKEFDAAKVDPLRPKDTPVWAWIMQQRLLVHGDAYDIEVVGTELPLRFYEEDLNILDNLTEIIYQMNDPEDFATYFYQILNLNFTHKNLIDAEEGISDRLWKHYFEIRSVLFHFMMPERFPTPRSFIEMSDDNRKNVKK